MAYVSNVWRKAARPNKFANDPDLDLYQKFHDACHEGTIQGFLSETTFTLEQIKRDDRLALIRSVDLEKENLNVKNRFLSIFIRLHYHREIAIIKFSVACA